MTANPLPPPEAELIRERREALIPTVSMREAAKRAGFSPALWGKIEHGYDQVAAGVVVPYTGTADKVAKMAAVTGITPEELTAAGRGDAARHLTAQSQPSLEERLAQKSAELNQALARIAQYERGDIPPRMQKEDDEDDRHRWAAEG